MHQFALRYGFFTTYNETVLLKQVNISGEWTLLYSRPLKQNASSRSFQNPNLAGKRPETKFTLREALLFLVFRSCTERETDNALENPDIHFMRNAKRAAGYDTPRGRADAEKPQNQAQGSSKSKSKDTPGQNE